MTADIICILIFVSFCCLIFGQGYDKDEYDKEKED